MSFSREDDPSVPSEPGEPDPIAPEGEEAPTLDAELKAELNEEELADLAEEGEDEEEEGAEAAEGEEAAAPKSKKDEEEVVKNPDTPVPSAKVMRSALDWAFEGEEDVTDAMLELFTRHALAVLEKNRVMNLTAILDPKEFAAKHYLDSWRVTRLVPLMAKKVVDFGTGGGFPGLAVAVAEPNCSMTMVDSTKKKIDFLEECVQKLGVKNAHTSWSRVEDYLTTERCDIVLVRAVSSVRENVRTLRKVRHSLKDLVMLKGTSWSREVRAAEREAERLGFKLDTVWEHELPGEMGGRAILVYRAPGGQGL